MMLYIKLMKQWEYLFFLTQENPNTSIQKRKKSIQICEFSVGFKHFKCSVQKAKWHNTKSSKKAIPRKKKKTAAQQLNTLSLWQTILILSLQVRS